MATILGTSGNDLITGGTQNDILNALAGADTMIGGNGNDTYYVDSLGDTVLEASGEGTDDAIIATVALSNTYSNVEHYDFSKLSGGVTFTGSDAANIIKGGAGIDMLAGGKGDDTYYLNSSQDVVVENAGEGNDTIAVTFSADLADYAGVENIRLRGGGALNATGNIAANTLIGNSGANVLDGQAGADTMAGGKGNDTYRVDNAGDIVVEYAGEGTDTVRSSVTHVLTDNVESLILQAGAGNLFGYGNAGANTIVGNEGNNYLDGKGGSDTMRGGKGNDFYVVGSRGDQVVENVNQGTDRVYSSFSFSLASLVNVEELQLAGGARNATGNSRANHLIGNSLDNSLDGGKGADKLEGGDGNDVYMIDNKGDAAIEQLSGGYDMVRSTVALGSAFDDVEAYDFRKAITAVNFTANDGSNAIWSGAFADTFAGKDGDDTYYLNSAADAVLENAGEGTDTIAATFSAKLSDYDNVENIRLLGAAAINAIGNSSANLLQGNGAANVLDGRGGADTLKGGKGNDTYHVDNVGDQVIEASGAGVDRVITAINHALADNVETLILKAGAGSLIGYGNARNNTIVGNEGNNILDGKGGSDTMKGGKGDDVYVVDSRGDRIVENANEGTDRIYSELSFSLASLINVEELQLVGNARNATGNARANHLIGNDTNNVLNGGSGADTLKGGLGNDTYIIDNKGDVVIEAASAGFDLVKSTVALSSAFDNVENYDFRAATTAVNFTGNAGNNTIWSSAFGDMLKGGDGADHYHLNNVGDRIHEDSGQGGDTAYVTFTVSALWDNVENLYYEETASTVAWNGTGNDLNNIIRGNDGRNILNGAGGDDNLQGRGGNDALRGGEGNDSMVGEAGNDTLIGGNGDDALIGEEGNDRMTGGAGADIYFYSTTAGYLLGSDVITDFDKDEDRLSFFAEDINNNGNYDQLDVVAGIVDQGMGGNVVVHLLNGGSITFLGAGTGVINSLDDLVADPTQLVINGI